MIITTPRNFTVTNEALKKVNRSFKMHVANTVVNNGDILVHMATITIGSFSTVSIAIES